MTQPLHDLSLMHEVAPPILLDAQAHPYQTPDDIQCAALLSQISALDQVLGPDVDAPPTPNQHGDGVAHLATDAVGGALSLPYRGIVRRISGAEREDKALRAAILAGVARRAFLKGIAQDRLCSPP